MESSVGGIAGAMNIRVSVALALLMLLYAITAWGQNNGPRNMGSGRRGDVLNTGDVDEQIAFNIDNTGGGSGNVGGGNVGGGGHGGGDAGGVDGGGLKAPQDCDTIMKVCQCGGGGTKGGGSMGGSKSGNRPFTGQNGDEDNNPPDYVVNNYQTYSPLY
ncbi:hypothetical protein J6590_014477 [Homalodisca vitripennis]|nr:hypothetical protein J6590_014477 [Homalodisca vitripennis]